MRSILNILRRNYRFLKRFQEKIRSNLLERLIQNIVKYKFSINRKGLSLTGSYKNFEDALRDSNGYSSKMVCKKSKKCNY